MNETTNSNKNAEYNSEWIPYDVQPCIWILEYVGVLGTLFEWIDTKRYAMLNIISGCVLLRASK